MNSQGKVREFCFKFSVATLSWYFLFGGGMGCSKDKITGKSSSYLEIYLLRVATSHGNHGNHGKVMELFLVMEKVMEFQKSSK